MKPHRMLSSAAAVLAAATVIAGPAVAHADNPAPGSECDSTQLNLTTTSSAGEGLRCLADNTKGYIWQNDDGTTQNQDDAERAAREACNRLPHHSNRSTCRSLLDNLPGR